VLILTTFFNTVDLISSPCPAHQASLECVWSLGRVQIEKGSVVVKVLFRPNDFSEQHLFKQHQQHERASSGFAT
jgi:hypothetical protein